MIRIELVRVQTNVKPERDGHKRISSGITANLLNSCATAVADRYMFRPRLFK
jgi:hypothetical protein